MPLLRKRDGVIDASDSTTAMTMLRYVFGTRPYDYRLLVAEDAVDLARELNARAQLREINRVGVVVLADVQRLLTEERYKLASSLKHQARLAIRRVLLHNDRLPRGIHHLGLPLTMRDYVDLLID